jgi:hypothetical protein
MQRRVDPTSPVIDPKIPASVYHSPELAGVLGFVSFAQPLLPIIIPIKISLGE